MKTTITRWAIRYPTALDEKKIWHCQGLPKAPDAYYAILYPTKRDAEKAWKRHARNRPFYAGRPYEIVPVDCTFEVDA